jgi:protocatechuate 3,4-dioxygenase beta subunit
MPLTAFIFAALLVQQPSPAAAQGTVQGTAELRGRLVDALGGQPLSGATVRLASTRTPPTPTRSATSDADGRFVFSGLSAGQYNLSVSRAGVVTTMFGATEERRVAPLIADGATVDLGDVRVPAGVPITGQILDENGNPLKGAAVSAWRMRYLSPGERRLDFAGGATSDERGDYRIAGLRPGTYFVNAKASDTIAPTFFPATASATDAAPITVTRNAGANASIRLLAIPLVRVSGRVVSAFGTTLADFVVMLVPLRDDGAQVSMQTLNAEVDASGTFAIGKVPPGNYSVEVVSKGRIEAIASSGSVGGVTPSAESGSARVTVDGRDVDDVFIRTRTPTMVSGKVLLDGTVVPAELAARLTLRIFANSGPSSISSLMNASFAQPDAGGTFAMPAIPGGRLLRVSGLPAGVALKRVLVDGADVTDAGFDIGSSAISDIVIELTSKPSTVSGRVADDQGVPIGGATVIVFSTDPSRWRLVQTRVVVAGRAQADGTFSFAALPAGSYYLAGVMELVDGDWAEPANLQRLRATAQTLKLLDGETARVTVTIKK